MTRLVPMKRKPAESSEELRARIRREATRLIAARGYAGVSVAEIAEASGLSKQALLYHFPSKQTLYEAVLDAILALAQKHLVLLVETLSGDADSRVEEAVGQVEALFAEEPHAAAVILRALLDRDAFLDRIRDGARPWFGLIAQGLREAQQAGRLRPDFDPEAVVAQLGTFVVATFAVLPVHASWTDADPERWRARRLRETIRTLERML